MEFVDSHAHLTDEAFLGDLDGVIARAQAAGVHRILTLGTDVESSRAAIKIAEKYEAVYAAVGIHPESVRETTLEDVSIIGELASHPRVVAIGEIGLDYYWDKGSGELQRLFFERQLGLAAQTHLPVSIHDREAHVDIVETMSKFGDQGVRGVLHAFSGDEEMAEKALEYGFLLSFGGPITFLNERKAPDLLKIIPRDKILIETDSPYLSPHPMRGQRNEPARVVRVAERLAELKNCTLEQVANQTSQNARTLFGF